MRYLLFFFILIEFVYASSGFCFIPSIEMTKSKNEDDDFAFFLNCVYVEEGEVLTALTVIPKKPGKWDDTEARINVFIGKEFIVRTYINELTDDFYERQFGKKPEDALRYVFSINPKYLENSYLSYSVGYSRIIEKKSGNGGRSIKPVSVGGVYRLNFKDFINIKAIKPTGSDLYGLLPK